MDECGHVIVDLKVWEWSKRELYLDEFMAFPHELIETLGKAFLYAHEHKTFEGFEP